MKNRFLYVLLTTTLIGAPTLLAAFQQPAAGRGGGRGGFGGPIELGPDDKPAFTDPPAGFNIRRENIPHGDLTAVQYDSKSLGTRRQVRVYTPPGYSANRKYPVLYLLHALEATIANGRRPAMQITSSTTSWPRARLSR